MFEHYKFNILLYFILYPEVILISGIFLKFNYCTLIIIVRRYIQPRIYEKANEKLLLAAGGRKLRNLLSSCYNLGSLLIN